MGRKSKSQELDAVGFAKLTGRRLDVVYPELRAGRVPGAYKLDGRWRIPQTSVSEWLHKRRTARRRRRQPAGTPAIPTASVGVAAQGEIAMRA